MIRSQNQFGYRAQSVILVLGVVVAAHAWPWDKKEPAAATAGSSPDTATAIQPAPDVRTEPVATTYIDTLNRGREVYLTAKDVTPAAGVIVEDRPAVQTSASTAAPTSPAPSPVSPSADGFQIQCIASSRLEMIKSEQKTLSSRIKYPLFIISTPPFYKLVAGDFAQRADAEKALAEVRGLGYPDAWITSRQARKP